MQPSGLEGSDKRIGGFHGWVWGTGSFVKEYDQSTLNRKLELEQRPDKGTGECQQYFKQPKPEVSDQGQHLVKIGKDVDKKHWEHGR